MQLIFTTALAIVSAASAANCTWAQLTAMGDLLATNVTAPCATSLKMNTTISTAISNPYGVCQPACATDLNSLSSGLPVCTETASIAASIAQLSQICTSLASPTTNGGACTAGDMMTNLAVFQTPVWPNCSTAMNATMEAITPTSPAAIQTLCASATCTAFLSSMEKRLPNCVVAGDVSKNSVNIKSTFQSMFGCTRAAVGAPCTMIDMATVMTTAKTPVWANCSTFLKLPEGATIDKVMPKDDAMSLPAGFCTSTCPQYLLSMVKSFPPCTIDGKNISDPTELYTLCPNVKPDKSGAATFGVFTWSYAVVLVTAVVVLF
ncbi:hypothetical protein SPRG_15689 [Saprolegnia parasitica CBS 223.65]|uniref:FZ domain-containing protein n=1 Tax=Saprolegnia parasitica (strain CBS 223.65) TaxID=695850 RepID=A0A067BXZ5_SAPPC|nr:hypothetical protein SPRG_15689 [Saprolegnia parasitica CBS 223.65]KDO19166.1 hypothetical protein SPRG_15689 [Saprolegnia parasitica CBS 223.65]|eukprot:XP_012210136.1 hypothetical protein SPRG_15689 [Saprolegnia parasitica CBS 223.65]